MLRRLWASVGRALLPLYVRVYGIGVTAADPNSRPTLELCEADLDVLLRRSATDAGLATHLPVAFARIRGGQRCFLLRANGVDRGWIWYGDLGHSGDDLLERTARGLDDHVGWYDLEVWSGDETNDPGNEQAINGLVDGALSGVGLPGALVMVEARAGRRGLPAGFAGRRHQWVVSFIGIAGLWFESWSRQFPV